MIVIHHQGDSDDHGCQAGSDTGGRAAHRLQRPHEPVLRLAQLAPRFPGEQVDYDYLMGVTGAAFRHFWNRDDGGNIDLFYLGQEPPQRAFRCARLRVAVGETREAGHDRRIKESIGRGMPVIAFGIIGPPEAGMVTGYADDGETLYGWSYFQEGRDAYYERPGWFETAEQGHHANMGALVLGEKLRTRPDPRQVYVDALRWAHAWKARRPGPM